MTPEALKRWRKAKGLKQDELADRLGIKRRILQYYEKGERGGEQLAVPVSIELACYALDQGVVGFDGETVIRGPIIRLEEATKSRAKKGVKKNDKSRRKAQKHPDEAGE